MIEKTVEILLRSNGQLATKFPIVRGIEIVFYSSPRGIEVIGYLNDLLILILSPKMRRNVCVSFFIANIALGFLLLFLIPRAIRISQIFTIHRTAGEGGGCFLISFLLLPPTLQTLSH